MLVLSQRAAYADLDYVTTGQAAILYDTPSSAGNRMAVVGPGYPLEVVVQTHNWLKVRDETGELLWMNAGAAHGKPAVMITVDQAAVLDRPHSDAAVQYRVARGVLLQLAGTSPTPGWLKVRHPQGGEGYLPLQDVWGQ
jgi:SH3-like domain-containing protein